MPTVSIVIRALNEAEHLPALFSGLLRQTRQPDQVDPRRLRVGRRLRRHRSGPRRRDRPHRPGGVLVRAGAEPSAAPTATGDVFVIVSAHVYPLDEKWLDLMVAPFERPEVGLVYGGQTGDSRSHFSELELLRIVVPRRQ